MSANHQTIAQISYAVNTCKLLLCVWPTHRLYLT
jgi:hypothetical protein